MPEAREKIGVVGAGLMGAEIALVFALAGHEVVLSDRSDELLNAALDRLGRVLDRGIPRGFYKPEEKSLALARIAPTVALDPFAECDFVTEAVFEDESVKAETYRRLDPICQPRCIFASNTSTIPISTLASYVGEVRRPYFIGTHYFSPASRMKLVEIIPAFDTAPETVETALRLCRAADKTPIEVKDVAGFAVNRMFLVFLMEAVRLVEDGVATPEDIDTACKLGLGHPMGPFELMDAVSSKLALQTAEILYEAYGERFRPPRPPETAGARRPCRRPRQARLARQAVLRAPRSVRTAEAFGRVRLSPSFFMRDFLHSEIGDVHGISNLPDDADLAIAAGKLLCEELLEPLQARFGRIAVRSAYRSPAVNRYGNLHYHNCGSNERNAARHIWDRRDAYGFIGAMACIVVPWFADRYAAGAPWQAMAWWIHDHLPYSELQFFPKLAAFNIGWHERPKRRIYSFIAPRGLLTKPGMANHDGAHADHYSGFPGLVTDRTSKE